MLELINVNSGYNNKKVLNNISLKFEKGNFYSIVGLNGSGKTTLLNTICNLINYNGTILLDDKELFNLPRKEIAKKIGYLTQSPDVVFTYNVFETVMMSRYPYMSGIIKRTSVEDIQEINSILKDLNIYDLKNSSINRLSGGQKQRVFLARAFAGNPDILILDEPTNHLDLKYEIEIIDLIQKWCKSNNKIVIAVLHDLNIVMKHSDEVILIDNGYIKKQGKSKDVLLSNELNDVYSINVSKYMINTLNDWKSN